ncbi:DUF3592 domain-containing protein [Novosphingobium sp.]|uniref:DUF3592 domain-containing protein n=1 Tax=Novosphingobium sp. TaxID=1874826 RepID=UPI0033417686
MASLFLLLAIVAWVAMVYALWRVACMLAGWRPTPAQVCKSDYTDTQQWEDRWLSPMMTSRGYSWRDGDDMRMITDEIVYTPADGHQRRALVERQVVRGWQPSGVYTVWYDTADPTQVTFYGPFYWLLMAASSGVIAGVLFQMLILTGGMAAVVAELPGLRQLG